MYHRYAFGWALCAAALLRCSASSQGTGLEARLQGHYVEKLQVLKGDEANPGAQQPLSLHFQASGMKGVHQFELVVAPEPAEAFDLEAATFEPDTPFITIGSGVQLLPEKHLRMAGLSLGLDRDGEAGLGILHLKTSAAFTPAARLRVLSFSIGPSSKERDTYAEQELNLGLSFGP